MSGTVRELPATANTTGPGYAVAGSEELKYSYSFVDSVFDTKKEDLSAYYTKWGRVLILLDTNVEALYGSTIRQYFDHYSIKPTLHVFKGGELNKTMDTMLQFCSAMDDFGLIRKEPVLVVGGGLASDVAGYACASYRRSTNYIRVSTTLIGLIDASISIKVGLNYGKLKNVSGGGGAECVRARGRHARASFASLALTDTQTLFSASVHTTPPCTPSWTSTSSRRCRSDNAATDSRRS
jgi:3-dehydroquinate synthase